MPTKTLKIAKHLFRAGTATVNKDDGTVRMSVSSDTPYERFDYDEMERYFEVLDHSPAGIDMTRMNAGTSVLFNHDRDILLGRQVGFDCDGHKLFISAKMSNAPDVASYRMKMEEGILIATSVGYQITGDGVCVGQRDGVSVYKFPWQPYESSLVTIEADITVGVGRQREHAPSESPIEISIKTLDETPEESHTQTTGTLATPQKSMSTAAAETTTETKTAPVDTAAIRRAALAEHRAACKKIDDFVDGIKLAGWKSEAEKIAKKHKANDEPNFDEFRTEANNAFTNDVQVTVPETRGNVQVIGERGGNGNAHGIALGIGDRFTGAKGFKDASEAILSRRQNSNFKVDLENGTLGVRAKAAMARAGFTSSDLSGVNATLVQTPIILGVQKLTIMDLISPGTMDHTSIVYPIENTFNPAGLAGGGVGLPQAGVAASVAERNLKPSWEPDLSIGRADAQVIAVMATVPMQFLQDFAAFGSYLNERGPYLVDIETERQMLYGDGLNGNLLGITSTAGILTRVTQNNTPVSGNETCYDSLYKALTDIRVASFFEPDGYAIHPYDWEVIRLMKDGNGQPIATGPFYAPYGNGVMMEVNMLWGKPVAISVSVKQGRPIAGAWKLGAQYFVRMGMQIEMSNSHLDYFQRNLMAVRFEHRLALAVYRPSCFEELTAFPART